MGGAVSPSARPRRETWNFYQSDLQFRMKLWVLKIVVCVISYILQISSVVLVVCQLCKEQSRVNNAGDCVTGILCLLIQCKLPLECNLWDQGKLWYTAWFPFAIHFFLFHDSLWLPHLSPPKVHIHTCKRLTHAWHSDLYKEDGVSIHLVAKQIFQLRKIDLTML